MGEPFPPIHVLIVMNIGGLCVGNARGSLKVDVVSPVYYTSKLSFILLLYIYGFMSPPPPKGVGGSSNGIRRSTKGVEQSPKDIGSSPKQIGRSPNGIRMSPKGGWEILERCWEVPMECWEQGPIK